MSKNLRTVLLTLLSLSVAIPAYAAGLPISIHPARIQISAAPGDSMGSSFTFWNGTNEFLPVSLVAADFLPSDEEGHVTVGGSVPEGNSLKEWIHPEFPQVAVAPKTEFEFRFSVDVPKSADPGTHYGALLISTASVNQGPGAAILAKDRSHHPRQSRGRNRVRSDKTIQRPSAHLPS